MRSSAQKSADRPHTSLFKTGSVIRLEAQPVAAEIEPHSANNPACLSSVARLVDSLTMALPFEAAEKQMLLETVDAQTRLASFVALINGEFEVPDSATRH